MGEVLEGKLDTVDTEQGTEKIFGLDLRQYVVREQTHHEGLIQETQSPHKLDHPMKTSKSIRN